MTNSLKSQLFLVFLSFSTFCSLDAQNNALDFDGVNDRVNCGNFLPSSYTKEAWIYVTNLSDDNNIVSGSSSALHVFWVNGGQIAAGHNGSFDQVKGGPMLIVNTWYHVAVTYDAPTTTMNLYLNGTLVSGPNIFVSSVPNNSFVQIGNFDLGDYGFAGSIDEVRIWDVARSAAQIAGNMGNSFPSSFPNLVANYHFNQGVASGNNTGLTSLADDSGNNHSGTFSGLAMTGGASNFISSGIVVLAAELIDFQAIARQSTVQLTWQTASESHNKGFQIERLNTIGNNWEMLGFVAAANKSATYTFTDNQPLNVNYYRLRQMDDDGKETLSKVVSATFKARLGSDKTLKIYPSVVSDFLSIETDDMGILSVYNLVGQQVMTEKNDKRINISALPNGTYIIKMGNKIGRFVKQ